MKSYLDQILEIIKKKIPNKSGNLIIEDFGIENTKRYGFKYVVWIKGQNYDFRKKKKLLKWLYKKGWTINEETRS